jgi:glycosyltransferase involved in cell wall biosynthesis
MIVGLFPQLSGAGGIQRSGCLTALALASFAAERGEGCRFVSLNDRAGAGRLRTGGREIGFTGCGGSKARFVSSVFALAIRQPIIVLALHPNLAPVVAAMRILAPGVQNVVVVHGMEVWTPLRVSRRWSLQSVDRVLAPSEDTLSRAAKEQRLLVGKGRKLAWSLGPEFDHPAVPYVRSLPPQGFPRGRVILTVGRWEASEAYKGADHLIAALPALLQSFSDVHFVAVGEGSDLPRLQSLARESPVSDHIHFLPFIAHDELPNAYDHCQLFAMPSRGEGFGLVFIEAMARGKPVIGGAQGGTPEIIDDGINGFLVPYGDVALLANRLECLLANDALRREMGAQALAKARREFTFARFSSELAAILRELLD